MSDKNPTETIITDTATTSGPEEKTKKNLYQRWQDKKRGKPISDEDLQKYLGKSREEIIAWSETRPGVGKNQLAGGIAIGPASGLGGVAAADGYGGWGPSAAPKDANRGMKFPPEKK